MALNGTGDCKGMVVLQGRVRGVHVHRDTRRQITQQKFAFVLKTCCQPAFRPQTSPVRCLERHPAHDTPGRTGARKTTLAQGGRPPAVPWRSPSGTCGAASRTAGWQGPGEGWTGTAGTVGRPPAQQGQLCRMVTCRALGRRRREGSGPPHAPRRTNGRKANGACTRLAACSCRLWRCTPCPGSAAAAPAAQTSLCSGRTPPPGPRAALSTPVLSPAHGRCCWLTLRLRCCLHDRGPGCALHLCLCLLACRSQAASALQGCCHECHALTHRLSRLPVRCTARLQAARPCSRSTGSRAWHAPRSSGHRGTAPPGRHRRSSWCTLCSGSGAAACAARVAFALSVAAAAAAVGTR